VHLTRPAVGPTQLPVQWVPGLLAGGKPAGGGVDHPPGLKARLRKSTALPLLPLRPFMAGYKVKFSFLTHMAGEWL